MSVTRASIDRKLDILATRAAVAKQIAMQRSVAALALGAVGVIAMRWFSHRRRRRTRFYYR